MSELKPCHLCGSSNLYQGWCDVNRISCIECGLSYGPQSIGSAHHPDKDLVSFAWNNNGKHPSDCVDLFKENKKLRFMIDNGLGWEDMKGGNREDVG